jgi:hypothetical protein
MEGKGDSRCLGVGIFTRLDGNGTDSGRLYSELSAHVGKVKHNFSSDDLVDSIGTRAKYSLRGTYFGFHGGVGYIRKISDSAALDAYGKFIWTRKIGGNATVSTGETVHFGDVDSERILAGLTLSRTINTGIAVRLGGACSCELAGKADAAINGLSVEAPSLRGASAVFEIGLSGKWSGFKIDVSAHGYLGKRRGLDAFLSVKHTF